MKPLAEIETSKPLALEAHAPSEAAALAGIAVAADAALEDAPHLPSDHPAWARDMLSLSQRARSFLATLAPIAIRTLTYWDHRVRSIVLRAGTLTIDISGSYRLE